jgi:hypothetical protein
MRSTCKTYCSLWEEVGICTFLRNVVQFLVHYTVPHLIRL